jgi:hypothetical protein
MTKANECSLANYNSHLPRARHNAHSFQHVAVQFHDCCCLDRLYLGYALPGSVMAVGIPVPMTRSDNWMTGQ